MKQLPRGIEWRVWRGLQPGRIHITIGASDYTLGHSEAIELANQLTDQVEKSQ